MLTFYIIWLISFVYIYSAFAFYELDDDDIFILEFEEILIYLIVFIPIVISEIYIDLKHKYLKKISKVLLIY